MAGVLDGEWSPDSINQAPDEIRTLAARFGGVRSDSSCSPASGGRAHAPVRAVVAVGRRRDHLVAGCAANCDRPTELYPQVRAVFKIA